MFTNEVPLKCAKNRWTEILGCPNSNVIDHWYSADKNLIQLPNWTFGQYNTWLMSIKNKSLTSFKNNIPGYCYGYNPNNWPNATVVIPDPCENISWNTKIKDISNECRQRIAKNLPVNSFYQNLKTQLLSTNASNNTNNLFYNVGVADWSQSLVA
jgi:hypothetical protein